MSKSCTKSSIKCEPSDYDMEIDGRVPMDADDADRIDVRGDGRVILYKRPGLKNPKWQARIRVPNAAGYKIVTTKTAVAIELARRPQDHRRG